MPRYLSSPRCFQILPGYVPSRALLLKPLSQIIRAELRHASSFARSPVQNDLEKMHPSAPEIDSALAIVQPKGELHYLYGTSDSTSLPFLTLLADAMRVKMDIPIQFHERDLPFAVEDAKPCEEGNVTMAL